MAQPEKNETSGTIGTSSSEKTKILFVCTSNVCRSPMAEFIGKVHAAEKGYTNLHIYSRGLTDNYSHWGSPTNPKAVDVCTELYGMDCSGHESTLLLDEDLEQCDVIFVVTGDHIRWIKHCVSKNCYDKNIHKLRSIGDDIPDPWFFSRPAYVDCAHMLKEQVGGSIDDFLEGKPGRIPSAKSEKRANKCYNTWPRG